MSLWPVFLARPVYCWLVYIVCFRTYSFFFTFSVLVFSLRIDPLCLVFFHTKQAIGLGKRLRNELFCVQWDVKSQLNQSINDAHFLWQLNVRSQLTLQSAD